MGSGRGGVSPSSMCARSRCSIGPPQGDGAGSLEVVNSVLQVIEGTDIHTEQALISYDTAVSARTPRCGM